MSQRIQETLIIPEEMADLRLDQAVSKLLPSYSRTQIQDWIKSGEIQLDGKTSRARERLFGGETVQIDAALKEQPTWTAEAIPLDIIYEDEALLVVNKPIGMVVHPAAGNHSRTLLNALLHHCPSLQDLPRAGILHRLDKDTSGLLVIAKTSAALNHLSKQLKARTMKRIYQAVVNGYLTSGGTVNAPIGRHYLQRKQMAVSESGKPAVTHYRVIERYREHTRLRVQLETGRTHQIRVHMAYIHHSIVGDPVYGGRLQLPKGATPELIEKLRGLKHQALHAFELEIIHPTTHQTLSWKAPLPQDMRDLITCLRNDMPDLDDEEFDE